ncbi:MAG: response regulator [Chitinophagaceae bacterium]|nr:response regulator [Chitinophagaceae bacterium]
MPIAGPIIVVDDDFEDQEIFEDVLKELDIPNNVIFFQEGQAVLDYLSNTSDKPFIIISDINLSGRLTGLELRAEIIKDNYLRRKSIPFVYLTTSNAIRILNSAYEMEVQGFFLKQSSYNAIKAQIKMILEYWKLCEHPIV